MKGVSYSDLQLSEDFIDVKTLTGKDNELGRNLEDLWTKSGKGD